MTDYQTTFVTPPKQDFDTVGFQGSMQQVLQENIGNYVIIDFLTGSNNLVSKQGILYNVSSQFLVLYDDINLRYVVCDIFAVKFVTFLLPGYRPGQVPSPALADEEEAVREDNNMPPLTIENTMPAMPVSPEDTPAAEVPLDNTSTAQETAALPATAEIREQQTISRLLSQAAFKHAVKSRV